MTQILLNPTAGMGGGASATSNSPTPDPAASAAAVPQKVTLSLEDFEVLSSYRARVADLEAAEAHRIAEAARAQETYLIEKGKYEDAIKARDERYGKEVQERDSRLASLDRTFKSTLLDKELTTALAGFPLVPGAATQLTALLRSELEVVEAGGQFRVQTRTMEPVGHFLKSRLCTPDFEHFLKPSGGPGSGAGGGHQTLPNHRQNPAPQTPDEEIFTAWGIQQSKLAKAGFAARGLKGSAVN